MRAQYAAPIFKKVLENYTRSKAYPVMLEMLRTIENYEAQDRKVIQDIQDRFRYLDSLPKPDYDAHQ